MVPDNEHRRRFDVALDPASHPLDRLLTVRQLRAHLDRIERQAVRDVRHRNLPMAAAARALGVSRQALHQRLGAAGATEAVLETAEDAWWRRHRELEQMAADLLARRRLAQAPMA